MSLITTTFLQELAETTGADADRILREANASLESGDAPEVYEGLTRKSVEYRAHANALEAWIRSEYALN